MTSIITTKKYPVGDIKLNVAVAGIGEPLVLIHGWSNNWIGWTLLAQLLSPHYRLYMIDLPGFGDSDKLSHYSIEIVTGYINKFITSQHIHPKALIGASLGTLISVETLRLYPNLTNKAILLGAVFSQDSLKLATKFFMKMLNYADKSTPSQLIVERTVRSRYTAYLVEKFLNAYHFDRQMVDKYSLPGRRKVTAHSYIQLGYSASKINIKDYLKTTDKQVLLIYGEAEKYAPVPLVKNILNQCRNPNLHLCVIPRAGHNPAYEQPQKTASAIKKFLVS